MINFSGPRPSTSQTVTRIALGAIMGFAGVSHLTVARDEFQAQVPDWLPVGKDFTVVASGVAEVALGASLLALPKQRRATGIALAAFYTAIFPGNIAQYAERKDGFHLDTDRARLIRLFFQPALVAAALWSAGIPESHR